MRDHAVLHDDLDEGHDLDDPDPDRDLDRDRPREEMRGLYSGGGGGARDGRARESSLLRRPVSASRVQDRQEPEEYSSADVHDDHRLKKRPSSATATLPHRAGRRDDHYYDDAAESTNDEGGVEYLAEDPDEDDDYRGQRSRLHLSSTDEMRERRISAASS